MLPPTIFIVTILDGADFDARMTPDRAFSTQTLAYAHAAQVVSRLKAERVKGGETDPAFVEAIYSRVDEVPLD